MPAKLAEDRPPSSRSKRDAILAAATTYFGREGYEDSKWADVAKAVGIGSTALYHYFESKLHCLYVIMADALEGHIADFERITSQGEDYIETLTAVLRSGFDLTEQEVLRQRVLVAEQALLAIHRTSPREEGPRACPVRCGPAQPSCGRRRARGSPASAHASAPATSSARGPRSCHAGWNR